VNGQPHETWMIKIKIADPGELDKLMTSTAYDALVQ
jgi:glycine cleavage system H lipoate-binding protein